MAAVEDQTMKPKRVRKERVLEDDKSIHKDIVFSEEHMDGIEKYRSFLNASSVNEVVRRGMSNIFDLLYYLGIDPDMEMILYNPNTKEVYKKGRLAKDIG